MGTTNCKANNENVNINTNVENSKEMDAKQVETAVVNNQNEVESLNQNEKMEEVKESMTSAETKLQAVEKARETLIAKKKFLAENSNAEANIKKSAEINVGKAERSYLEALKTVELPTTKVEFWNLKKETEKQVILTKENAEIIIATSVYSMATSKVGIDLGKDLITNDKFEKTPLYVTNAKLFYDAEIELKDLNGNIIAKGTPNVYVSVDTANGYWQWATFHEYNLNAIVKDETNLTIENVRTKEFSSLQEFAQYRGVNNVLSRGFNGLEKAGNAALATQNEFYKKIFEKAKELKANISVVTKYYNLGKTLNLKVWNDAMLGYVDPKFTYDLSVGDNIITTLQSAGFEDKFLKERYMIDAMTRLVNHKPQGAEAPLGITEVLTTIKSLDEKTVSFIPTIALDKVNEIYAALHEQYLKNNGTIKTEEAA